MPVNPTYNHSISSYNQVGFVALKKKIRNLNVMTDHFHSGALLAQKATKRSPILL